MSVILIVNVEITSMAFQRIRYDYAMYTDYALVFSLVDENGQKNVTLDVIGQGKDKDKIVDPGSEGQEYVAPSGSETTSTEGLSSYLKRIHVAVS